MKVVQRTKQLIEDFDNGAAKGSGTRKAIRGESFMVAVLGVKKDGQPFDGAAAFDDLARSNGYSKITPAGDPTKAAASDDGSKKAYFVVAVFWPNGGYGGAKRCDTQKEVDEQVAWLKRQGYGQVKCPIHVVKKIPDEVVAVHVEEQKP